MMLEASRIGPAEQRAVEKSSALSFISEVDRAAVPHPGVESVVANAALDLGRLAPTGVPPVPDRIGFLGNLRTASNRDMVTYFAKEVFPAVRAVVPGAEFHIIGHEAGADVRRLARLRGVVFVGPVDDQGPVLEACWLTVCPLRFGSGVQNKIIESLALGTPVVTTPSAGAALVASEGDSPGPGSPAVIAELGSAFSEQVVGLLQDRSRRDQLGRAGRAWVTAVHRPERALAPLLSLVQRLAAAGSSPLV